MTTINKLIWLPIVTVIVLSIIFTVSAALHYYLILGLSFVGIISALYTMSAIVEYKQLRDDELKNTIFSMSCKFEDESDKNLQ